MLGLRIVTVSAALLSLTGCVGGCVDDAFARTLSVQIWNLPDDVMTASLRVDDGQQERGCAVIFEPLEDRDGGGPGEPGIESEDCDGDVIFTYTYIREWGVVFGADRAPRTVTVDLEFTNADGSEGGFEDLEFQPDWQRTNDADLLCPNARNAWIPVNPEGQVISPP